MPNVTLRAVLTGTNAGLVRTFNESALAGEQTAHRISTSGTEGAAKFSAAFEKHTTLVGGSLAKLGQVGATFGLPFSESLDKIAHKLDVAKQKGQGFGATMHALGGLTLGVGIAGALGVSAVALHEVDEYEKATVSLSTAIRNAHGDFEAFQPTLHKTENAFANLGFEDDEVVNSLARLTTATGSTAQALAYESDIANIARLRHMSMADATQSFVKILAGNTRGIAQWGMNLDLVSGKMHSLKAAHGTLEKAQATLKVTQEEIANGHIKAGSAAHDLAVAQDAVRTATIKYHDAQQAIPAVIEAVRRASAGAGEEFAHTFPGQVDIARAKLKDLADDYGLKLVHGIGLAEIAAGDIIGWFGKNETATYTLATAVGGVLTLAVATFVKNTAVSMVTGLGKMATGLFTTGGAATAAATETEVAAAAITASTVTMEASFAALTAAVVANTATIAASMGGTAAEIATADQLIIVSNGNAATSFAGIGAAAAVTSETVVAAEATTAVATAGIGTAVLGLAGTAGPLALLGLAAYTLATDWSGSWDRIAEKVHRVAYDIKGDVHDILNADNPLGQIAPALKLPYHVLGFGKSKAPEAQFPGGGGGDFSGHGSSGGWGTTTPTKDPWKAPPKVTIPPVGGPTGMSAVARAAFQREAEAFDKPLRRAGQGPTDLIGQGPTVKALREELTPVHEKALQALVAKLNGTHDSALITLATKLESDWKGAQDKLTSIVDSDLNAGQSELAKLQGAITSGSLNGLKGAVTGIAETKFAQLITALAGVHTKAGDEMVTELKRTFAETQGSLASELVNEQRRVQTDMLKNQLQALQDQTTAVENASRAQVQAITDAAAAISISMQTAATRIGDASRIMSDKMSATAQAITDATNAAHNIASARAQAIQNQSQLSVDIMQQQGLYGLNLVAQQQTVALDRMRIGFDSQIANAQSSIDSVTASGHATINQAQSALSEAVAIQNSLVAQAQASAQAIAQQSNQMIAGAQSQLDQTQRDANAKIAFAADQNAYTVAHGSEQQKRETASKLESARAQADMMVGQAQGQFSAAANAANMANAQAQSALQGAQDQANAVKAAADAALSAAQGNAAIVLAQAQQALSQASDQAMVAEAQQQAQIAETRARANTQFAGGGGVNINITGLPTTNAEAIASAVSWAARTQVSNAG